MEPNLSLEELDSWKTGFCHNCDRTNFNGSNKGSENYVEKLFELKIGHQSVVICKVCLASLKSVLEVSLNKI